jgi:hypothetical protein
MGSMQILTCERPIFVVGAPRSGTSMMQWALRQHPALWGGPESDFLVPLVAGARDAYELGTRREKLHWLSGQKVSWPEFLQHVGHGVNALYTQRAGGLRWVEQTPQYTLHLADIATMFPKAQFLMMLRDGRDVVASLRNFALPQTHEQACRTWVRYVQAGREFGRGSEARRLMTIRYEWVVSDPHHAFQEILLFLQEAYEPACARFVTDRPPINSSFRGGTREQRWRSWSTREMRVFERIAGSTFREEGFVP